MDPNFVSYLKGADKAERLQVLHNLKKTDRCIPLGATSNFLYMNLDQDEKQLLLEVSSCKNKIELEHYLTKGILVWDQNLASAVLRKWSADTDHLLWFRLIAAAKAPTLAQRLGYTVLDVCEHLGSWLLHSLANHPALEEFSPAFHSLLMLRSLEWNVDFPILQEIAERSLQELQSNPWPAHKAIPVALLWQLRFRLRDFVKKMQDPQVPRFWREYCRLLFTAGTLRDQAATALHEKQLLSFFENPPENRLLVFHELWPHLVLRHTLGPRVLAKGLVFLQANAAKFADLQDKIWEYFTGISESVLCESVLTLSDPMTFAFAVRALKALLPQPPDPSLLQRAKELCAKAEDPGAFLGLLNQRFRLALDAEPAQPQARILQEETVFLRENFRHDLESSSVVLPLDLPRQFFALTFEGKRTISADANTLISAQLAAEDDPEGQFWAFLCKNWLRPQVTDLPKMATLARQMPPLYQFGYIRTLGRFAGSDVAALKLLDFVRSPRENELQEVVLALGGIGTPRSYQELIFALTRPNSTPALQLEICEVLRGKDLHGLQGELRSAINDLQGRAGSGDVLEAVESLLETPSEPPPKAELATGSARSASSESLDRALVAMISRYDSLSSEVRRALRTALFFNQQVEQTDAGSTIDLSPVVNMQYKALELIFRETFEELCFKVINQGILQRKLDVLGYARPVPRLMDEFENYLGNLPVVRDIPYFSKFKLRKMLRALCQYRPGRRFTLDGIKAFALFFLCFGRKKCPFGLNDIVPLGFAEDKELAEFCKMLHVFQDFRNRAAHEGFRPQDRADMEGIWRKTGSIISVVFTIKQSLINHKVV